MEVIFKHSCSLNIFSLPRWHRGSGLDCGAGNAGLIPGIPSLCVGLLMARRLKTSSDVKDVFGCPGARLGTLKTPSCLWYWVPGSRSKFSNWTTVPSLYSGNIADWKVKPQPTNHHYIVHPSTISHLYRQICPTFCRGRGVFASCLNFVIICSAAAEGKSKMSRTIRDKCSNLCWWISPKINGWGGGGGICPVRTCLLQTFFPQPFVILNWNRITIWASTSSYFGMIGRFYQNGHSFLTKRGRAFIFIFHMLFPYGKTFNGAP